MQDNKYCGITVIDEASVEHYFKTSEDVQTFERIKCLEGVTFETTVLNFTDRNLVILTKDGIRTNIQPVREVNEFNFNGVIIAKTYRFSRIGDDDNNRVSIDDEGSPLRKAYIERFKKQLNNVSRLMHVTLNNPKKDLKVEIVSEIKYPDIVKAGGVFYFQPEDIVIAFTDKASFVHHPNVHIDKNLINPKGGVSFNVRFNDPNNCYTTPDEHIYINLANVVISAKILRNINEFVGLTITSLDGNTTTTQQRFHMSEVTDGSFNLKDVVTEKPVIYRTMQDALLQTNSHNVAKIARENVLRQMDIEADIQKEALKLKAEELKQQTLQTEKEMNSLKSDKVLSDMESDRNDRQFRHQQELIKLQREREQYERERDINRLKSQNETTKQLLVVVTGVITLAVALLKLKK